MNKIDKSCKICDGKLFLKFFFNKKPRGETNFYINKNIYYRETYQCSSCKHFYSFHKINLKNIYKNKYIKDTYGNSIEKKFLKIINLKYKESDNKKRCRRIINFLNFHFVNKKNINILDIGSGLGVFPYIMKTKSFDITALDPDTQCCQLMKKYKIKNINLEFKIGALSRKFNLITLNKVLEHFKNPKILIKNIRSNLKKNHLIYIEVPDGEKASKINKNREEFFIEHWHCFSKKSLKIFLDTIGLEILKIGSIQEPSSKNTLFAFAKFKNKYK